MVHAYASGTGSASLLHISTYTYFPGEAIISLRVHEFLLARLIDVARNTVGLALTPFTVCCLEM